MDDSAFISELKNLTKLHVEGALTDDEFAKAKARLLRAPTGMESARSEINWNKTNQRQTNGTTKYRAGSLTAVGGGVLALIAFFYMPLVTIPLLGSLTAGETISHSSDGDPPPGVAFLWFILLALVVVTGLNAWQSFAVRTTTGTRRTLSRVSLGLGTLVTLAYTAAYLTLQAKINGSGAAKVGVSASTLTGAGFWFALLGAIVATIGAIVALTTVATTESPKATEHGQTNFRADWFYRAQLLVAWFGPVMFVLTLASLAFLAHYASVNFTAPHDTLYYFSQEISPVHQLLAILFSLVLGLQFRRIAAQTATLATLQFGCVVVLTGERFVPIAIRTSSAGHTADLLVSICRLGAVALAILISRKKSTVFPRWIAYYCLALATLSLPTYFATPYVHGWSSWGFAFTTYIPTLLSGLLPLLLTMPLLHALRTREKHGQS